MLSSGRFVTSTGQAAVKDDEHMTAYIDSKLAESHFKTTNTATELQQSSLGTPAAEGDPRELRIPSQSEGTKSRHHAVEEVEIDKSGQAVAKEEPSKHSRRREPKPRIGRDGKPLPPRRPRGYRSENDKARDSLVERLLAENRVEGIYDAPDAANSADDKRRGQDLEADARMAEEFEREFQANAEERRAKMKARPASKTVEPISGPKLGGSKNARAAKK
ncbi:hypothetical protein B9Z65_5470 [Elsinoe australis]|uniref:Uncharacterized protein n=1 Tax=Elsinoe australis TaxID=40998 RepID=A0A2P7ZE66_9PEZI|nr:hypothetical protein B9Z65_5470 [Elsinoe australis]